MLHPLEVLFRTFALLFWMGVVLFGTMTVQLAFALKVSENPTPVAIWVLISAILLEICGGIGFYRWLGDS